MTKPLCLGGYLPWLMILSTCSRIPAAFLYISSVTAVSFLLIYVDWDLTIKFASSGVEGTTQLDGALMWGIAVAALTYSGRHYRDAYATLSFGFVLTFYPILCIYSDLKKDPLPVACLDRKESTVLLFPTLSFPSSSWRSRPTDLLFDCRDRHLSPLSQSLTPSAQYFKNKVSTSAFCTLTFPTTYITTTSSLKMAQEFETSISGIYSVLAETVICLYHFYSCLGWLSDY